MSEKFAGATILEESIARYAKIEQEKNESIEREYTITKMWSKRAIAGVYIAARLEIPEGYEEAARWFREHVEARKRYAGKRNGTPFREERAK